MRVKQLKDRCGAIEQEIARMETEIAGYESRLANFTSAAESMRLASLVEERRTALAALMSEWEELSLQLESA